MNKNQKEFWLKKVFHSSWFFAIILFFLIIFSISLVNEMMRKVEIQNEIDSLEKQVQELEDNNSELEVMINYFQTEEFIEKEARTKLGYKKVGESVVSVPKGQNYNLDYSIEENKNLSVNKENWQLWLDYFFNKN